MAEGKGGPRIPLEPFIGWCETKLVEYGGPDALKVKMNAGGRFNPDATGARDRLAAKLGIASRTLWRYTHWRDSCGRPTTVAPRWYVEDMLERAGLRFSDLYPGSFEKAPGERGPARDVLRYIDLLGNCCDEEIELEPDAWCRCCREFVTPIFGCCPWDDTPIHMELAA